MNDNILHNVDANDNIVPIDIDDVVRNPRSNQAAYLQLLDNIQGNILKDHGRDHSIQIFLHNFNTGDTTKIKQSIQALAQARYSLENDIAQEQEFHYMASAKEQHLLSKLSKHDKEDYRNTYFVNFFLSKKGFEALGGGIQIPNDSGFKNGLGEGPTQKRFEKKGISFKEWDGTFSGLDAMILIAHSKKESLLHTDSGKRTVSLDAKLRGLVNEFKRYIKAIEPGDVIVNAHNQPIEHFGYRDGISNPLFFKSDLDERKAQDIGRNFDKWSPAAPLKLVLVPDPNCKPKDHAYGSYLVFGKLEQNVRNFNVAIKALADKLNGASDKEKQNRARALVMGRFPDGTPITCQEKDRMAVPYPNNFDFAEDPYGGRCPIHAHVRRANPRGETREGNVKNTLSRRIVRRGITYDHRDTKSKADPLPPINGVGLHFMCFQRSIKEQFEFIIEEWCLYPPQQDAVMRDTLPEPDLSQPFNQWPGTWTENPVADTIDYKRHAFGKHVTLKGGEYFFAPSIKFLQNIASRK